ncbi:MAG: DUF1330 domain-containing protein [Streptosporangiaceae bacterium]
MLDETQGRRYRDLAAGSIARHGGRCLVRGAAPVVAEGNWPASTGLAWYRPLSALAIISCSGMSASGKLSVPSTNALP